jgi:hypothetical protein
VNMAADSVSISRDSMTRMFGQVAATFERFATK